MIHTQSLLATTVALCALLLLLPRDARAWGDHGSHSGEERLIGWGGETYDSRAHEGKKPNAVTLAAQDRERGTWVEPISWQGRRRPSLNIHHTR